MEWNIVTIRGGIEELDVEEDVGAVGESPAVRRQHDLSYDVSSCTHDHHWKESTKEELVTVTPRNVIMTQLVIHKDPQLDNALGQWFSTLFIPRSIIYSPLSHRAAFDEI